MVTGARPPPGYPTTVDGPINGALVVCGHLRPSVHPVARQGFHPRQSTCGGAKQHSATCNCHARASRGGHGGGVRFTLFTGGEAAAAPPRDLEINTIQCFPHAHVNEHRPPWSTPGRARHRRPRARVTIPIRLARLDNLDDVALGAAAISHSPCVHIYTHSHTAILQTNSHPLTSRDVTHLSGLHHITRAGRAGEGQRDDQASQTVGWCTVGVHQSNHDIKHIHAWAPGPIFLAGH